jgi:serine peptidase DegS
MRFVAESASIGLAVAFVAVMIRPQLAGLGARSTAGPLSFAAAVAASSPAVANVYTERTERKPGAGGSGNLEGQALGVPERALGSAVVIDRAGYLVTNWHVVKDADRIRVQLADGRTAIPELVGKDPETELALLRIHLPNLPTIKLGRSDELEVGEVVLAIGDSLGLSQTVTMGIVSATGRGQLGVATFENFIQTDAAINVGNSGGALVNTKGELVGINTAVISASLRERAPPEGIGFAIPVNLVRGVMAQLIEHGRVIRGYLGVRQTRDVLIPSSAGLDLHGTAIQVLAVEGPAAKAGLRPGDILTRINDKRVYTQQQAMNIVAGSQPGTAIKLAGYRPDGTPFQTQAVLEERPPLTDE